MDLKSTSIIITKVYNHIIINQYANLKTFSFCLKQKSDKSTGLRLGSVRAQQLDPGELCGHRGEDREQRPLGGRQLRAARTLHL